MSLMDMGFAITCSLARHRRPHHPVLVHRPVYLLHASFRPHLAVTPLRFAITSPPSGCEEDFHLPAVEHARRTSKNPLHPRSGFFLVQEPTSSPVDLTEDPLTQDSRQTDQTGTEKAQSSRLRNSELV